ncbi:HTH-type transcriptional regulator BetI [Paraburkholderia sediminicola]|uniref:HTH-type transcriptional regulator BetI n=1 Tax=Paraburkholderia sediminicola TaxID=458836 RepID=A0A6J5CQE7_9BURK|nr:TetR/AcrR family transcriptional regulator [Paraburkholderia sediminicola]CAB3741125.1 HTH-type transcriptional regulator BetI [Paraburkholderia sediminicola]
MREISITSAQVLGIPSEDSPKRRGRATRIPEILEVSIRVFAIHGNAGFTQRRIANDVGIHLRSLQHYFSTREELLRATVEEVARRYLQRYRTIVKDKLRPPEARLDAVVDEIFTTLTATTNILSAFALEAWSLAERDEFVRELLVNTTREFQEMFAGLVGEINPTMTTGECTLRGALLVSHLQGLIVYIRRAGENPLDMHAFQHATKVAWKALSKAPE